MRGGVTAAVMAMVGCGMAAAQSQRTVPPAIKAAREALAEKHFQVAKEMFAAYVKQHPGDIDGEEGIGDTELGMHEYEAAELQYRSVVAQSPRFWLAHKNLVIVEAALGRWGEFDREREVLRGARERGDPGISARESDVIDSFDVRGEHWIVREYYEPVGRSLTRYNFEYFGPDGRVREYVSLESADAARHVDVGGEVRIGDPKATVPESSLHIKDFALNYYTTKGHGTVRTYPKGEPSYERVRADVMRWLGTQPAE